MSDFAAPSPGQGTAQQRTALVGRVKMAKAMEMPEAEWSRLLASVESDPLFQELASFDGGSPIIRYRRFAGARLSDAFYAPSGFVHEHGVAAAADQRARLLDVAARMGRADFERLVIFREGPLTADAAQAERLLNGVAAQLDRFLPASRREVDPPQILGEVFAGDAGAHGISFHFPHLVRGLYDIDRMRMREWQAGRGLDKDSAARLRRIVGLMELSNMKQGALWRVLDRLLMLNREYLISRDAARLAPVSLRKLADQLDFAPSTVSRVVSGKALTLPWGDEISVAELMPGQRRVVLSILEKVLPEMTRATDMAIARRLRDAHGVTVSRRTITACRHIIEQQLPRENAA